MERAEQSKNAILTRCNISLTEAETNVASTLEVASLISLIIVFILILFICAVIADSRVFYLVFVYLLIMSAVYLYFQREYTSRQLARAKRTVVNFLSSERALEVLNGAAEVYNSTP